eukprot:TRINITY_DN1607_c0_g1_i2.p1 TRINITY_DN1607_c0_g1~~TRINITY_DN1607_c0_g1_i2.p1  ORF type:complete len:692 (-),score=112.19 TRINITY_DN1607_c0_g1_i2:106-2139(-)
MASPARSSFSAAGASPSPAVAGASSSANVAADVPPSSSNLFFEYLAALGAEHERLQVENAALRQALGAGVLREVSLSSQQTAPASQGSLRAASQGPYSGQDIVPPAAGNGLHTEPGWQEGGSAARQQDAQNASWLDEEALEPVAERLMTRAGVFDLGDMKAKMKAELTTTRESIDVSRFYKTEGRVQAIARHPWFEKVTMFIIVVYALWMSVDTDLNTGTTMRDTPLVFIVAEQFFCLYFTTELVIRFLAFQHKLNCLRDAWFVFDLILVTMMVAETWILNFVLLAADSGEGSPLGDMSILRLVRLVRLTRLLRMARLLRLLPELLIMVKAIAAATRSVSFAMMLLIGVIYCFGIAFTSVLKGTDIGGASYPTVLYSMHSLVIHGALLDDLAGMMVSLLNESIIAFFLMYVVVLIAAVTIMNMLIGILCEVITAVAEAERDAISILVVKETLENCMSVGDQNNDGLIDQKEFFSMLENQDVRSALMDIDVDPVSIYDYTHVMFGDDGNNKVPFVEFMDVLLKLRGSNNATVRDLVDLRKFIASKFKDIENIRDQMGSTCASSPMLQSLAKRSFYLSTVPETIETPKKKLPFGGNGFHRHDETDSRSGRGGPPSEASCSLQPQPVIHGTPLYSRMFGEIDIRSGLGCFGPFARSQFHQEDMSSVVPPPSRVVGSQYQA